MQTREERVEALRTLLPLVEAHLALMDRAGVAAYGDDDGEPAPVRHVEWPCFGTCHNCAHPCRGEAWEREYRRLRAAYPIIRKIERLLDELMYVDARWRCGVYYTLVQPWDDYDREHREEWCERGLEWMAARLRSVPTYEPWGREPVRVVSVIQVIQMRDEGCSIRQIARRLECSKSRVHQILAAHAGRSRRKESADS